MNINKFVLDLTLCINSNKIQSNDVVKVVSFGDDGVEYFAVKDIICVDGEIVIKV